MMAGTSGSDRKFLKPCSSQSKITQTRSASVGSRKTVAPLDPCCFRFSAPLVENTFRKRLKSSTFVVASIISFLLCWICRRAFATSFQIEIAGVSQSTGGAHPVGFSKARDVLLLRINDAEVLDDLEAAVAGLGDIHVHANMVLTGNHFG